MLVVLESVHLFDLATGIRDVVLLLDRIGKTLKGSISADHVPNDDFPDSGRLRKDRGRTVAAYHADVPFLAPKSLLDAEELLRASASTYISLSPVRDVRSGEITAVEARVTHQKTSGKILKEVGSWAGCHL